MKKIKSLFLILSLISCVENITEDELITQRSELKAKLEKEFSTSLDEVKKKLSENKPIDFSVSETGVRKEYIESNRNFIQKYTERTIFYADDIGNIEGRSFGSVTKDFEVLSDGSEVEVVNSEKIEASYVEKESSGNLGTHDEGMKVVTLIELYELCDGYIQDFSGDLNYDVSVKFDGNKLLSSCYYSRSSGSGETFKNGFESIEIYLN